MKYQFIVYLILVIVIVLLIYKNNSTNNELNEHIYQNKMLIQNDSTNLQIIDNLNTKQDTLLNRIRLIENNVITKLDTIILEKTIIDSFYSTQIDDSTTIYKFYDEIHYPRFEMSIDMSMTLLNQSIVDNNFKYKYIEYPDTIQVSIFFDKTNKLLYSESIVNGKYYKSNTNMYERVYSGIYNEFIENILSNDYKWYHRLNTSIGIGYNYKGEILPYIGIGYGINIKEISELWK